MIPILGLNGYARAGKDTLGGLLVDEYGYQRRAFADQLKALAEHINPLVRIDTDGSVPEGHVFLQALLHSPFSEQTPDWEYAKRVSSDVRVFLQHLGEGVRNVIGEDAWVRAVSRTMSVDGCPYVITDVRYPNEAAWVRRMGGQVWRINRKGVGAANDHISETALDYFDFDQVIEVADAPIEDVLLFYRSIL